MNARGRLDLDAVEAVGHVIGVIAIVGGISGLMLSIGLADDFSIQQDALSELGADDHDTAWLFNTTMIITGILATAFFGALINRLDDGYQRIGTAIMGLAGLGLAGVGLFPLGHGLHVPAAAIFFGGLSIGILVTAYGDHRTGHHRRARVALNLVLLHAVAWIFGIITLEGVALPELVGGLVYGIWVIILIVQRGRELPS